MPNFSCIYDSENDDIFLFKKKKTRSSGAIGLGGFVIDFDIGRNVAGIEILNASKNIKVPKQLLQKTVLAKVDTKIIGNALQIIMALYGKKEKLQEKMVMVVPSAYARSPATSF